MSALLETPANDQRRATLQQRLYVRLRGEILNGQLRPGQRAPSTRELAASLRISRTTVVLAYDQLLAEGYLEARRGAGTFVSRQIPDETFSQPAGPPGSSTDPTRTSRLSRWARRLPPVSSFASEQYGPVEFDFRPGRPDWDAFPHREWSRLTARRWRQHSSDLASYGDPAGFAPLREVIARHLGSSRGVRCDPSQVVVVNGSQQGVDLLSRIWLDPGEIAALENPGYPGASLALRANGVGAHAVRVDADGMVVDELPSPDSANSPRLVYVTPSHQYPTGATLSLNRRIRLIEWAARRGALVIEDDYDSEFRYLGRPLESLQGLDREGVVAYVGSFSKALFPPLRIGFVVLPPHLVERFVAAKWLADRQTATPDQQVLYDFINQGLFERHLRRMRRLYLTRRTAMLDAVRRHLGAWARPGGDGAGLHLVAWLNPGLDSVAIANRAVEAGVAVVPLAPYYLAPPIEHGLLLGFAAVAVAGIDEGARRLAQVIERERCA